MSPLTGLVKVTRHLRRSLGLFPVLLYTCTRVGFCDEAGGGCCVGVEAVVGRGCGCWDLDPVEQESYVAYRRGDGALVRAT
jgi:hypothetical protein